MKRIMTMQPSNMMQVGISYGLSGITAREAVVMAGVIIMIWLMTSLSMRLVMCMLLVKVIMMGSLTMQL
ncbi:MAG: hypothetical protein A2V90_08955 [Gammaproteobacteria bacterium RBG_16_57_12]|nr:MAG: hypothetical protein A2V90_08955 [Gammaproteobacteria bacterium RBG_16_57_12]